MNELKKCPFCGGEAELSDTEFINGHFVFCTQCHIQTKLYVLGNTSESAIKAWNNRKPAEEVVARLEEAREGFSGGTMQWYYYYNGITDAIEIVKEGMG